MSIVSGQRTLIVGTAWLAFFFFSIIYIPTFWINSLLHIIGGGVIWFMASWLFYFSIVGILFVIYWMGSGQRPSGAEPKLGIFVPSHWARRTGISGTDRFGLVIAIIISIFSFTNLFWLPWTSLVSLIFGLSVFWMPVEQWPIQPRRSIPDLPSEDPVLPSEEGEDRHWEWFCRCRPSIKANVDLRIAAKTVDARRNENNSSLQITASNAKDIVQKRVNEGSKDKESIEAARQLLSFARSQRFNYFEEAQNTLQMAQVIPYADDQSSKGREYFRYAVETFYDNLGDCDCKAILASTLFRLMGLRSILLLSYAEGHAAVAVEGAPDFQNNNYFKWNGGQYYFCETTDGSFDFTVGEVPPNVDLNRYDVRVEIEPALMAKPNS